MKVLLLLAIVALLAIAVYLVLSSVARRRAQHSRWRVEPATRADGTLEVSVRGEGMQRRVIRELPPSLEGADLTSELRLAKEEAQLQADELNRR